MEHLNPQLGESIRLLSNKTLGFINKCAGALSPLKKDVLDVICDIRLCQVEIDQKALELYDITLKLTSFLCMTNRMGKNLQLKSIDKLRMYFSPDGQKNKHVKAVNYLEEFMRSREPLIRFFGDVSDFVKKYKSHQEKKKKREEERKERERLRIRRLQMIERGLKK